MYIKLLMVSCNHPYPPMLSASVLNYLAKTNKVYAFPGVVG